MPTTHGAECDLRIERLTAEGMVLKEYIGTLDGGAANQSFFTKNFPITTGAGATTDDETQVNVYTDDLTLGTWTEYQDDGSDFVITGATGEVEIQAAENQAGNVNERISIDYYYAYDISRGQNVTIEFEGSLTVVHELGNRDPQEIKAGHKTIEGTIGRLYADRNLLGLVLSETDFYQRLTSASLYLYPAGNSGGNVRVKVGGAKFGSGSLGQDLDGLFMANVTFSGLTLTIDTVP